MDSFSDMHYCCSSCGYTQVRKAGALSTANVPTHCGRVMLALPGEQQAETARQDAPAFVLEIGHSYQNGCGDIIKVLARIQKDQISLPDSAGHFDTDPAQRRIVDCLLCRDSDGHDFYALPNGQTCGVWHRQQAEFIYSDPGHFSSLDMMQEMAPDKVNTRRFDADFTTTWLIAQSIRLHLKVQARNAESASDQLPPIGAVERVLRPLFEAAGCEVDELFYDESQQEIEAAEDEHASPLFEA